MYVGIIIIGVECKDGAEVKRRVSSTWCGSEKVSWKQVTWQGKIEKMGGIYQVDKGVKGISEGKHQMRETPNQDTA